MPQVTLRPLAVSDADAMATVLADPSLYTFTGGEPPTAEELRRRYTAQVRGGPADGSERWLNWLVLAAEEPVGYVQATVPAGDGGAAEIAWVIGVPWQGRGYAREAVRLLLAALAEDGVTRVVAHIHPEHVASQRVAAGAGMNPTNEVVDGEIRWSGVCRSPLP